MHSSSVTPTLQQDWSKCLITVLWVACLVFFLISFYESIKAKCIALYEDPIHPFRRRPGRQLVSGNITERPSLQFQSTGLASNVVHSLPTIQFSKRNKAGCHHDTDCAVCLGEFLEGESLRLLPDCAHVFHAHCIDTWFLGHSNCPLCRTSVSQDFSFCESTISTTSLLETLQREDVHREQRHSFRLESLAQSHALHIPESTTEAISSSPTLSDVNQSLDETSNPVAGPENEIQQVQPCVLEHS